MRNRWSSAEIPDLTGKHIIVTGGNRGLGYASVVEFAKKGAHVVLTSRSNEKGEAAIAAIQKSVPNASLATMELDCSSFQSVRAFAAEYKAKYGTKLDVLVNNAGMMKTGGQHPRIETKDGHEITWQTNVWSACLLSQLLLPTLANGATHEAPARIVFISSLLATRPSVKINVDDLENDTNVDHDFGFYPNTKCADRMIPNALTKRFEATSSLNGRVLAICAHPGFSSTEMTNGVGRVVNTLLGMPASQGCLSQVRVATDPNIPSGAFYGPNTLTKISLQHVLGLFGMMGHNAEPEFYGSPMPSALVSPFASDEELCEQLLKKAEEIIGAKFELA